LTNKITAGLLGLAMTGALFTGCSRPAGTTASEPSGPNNLQSENTSAATAPPFAGDKSVSLIKRDNKLASNAPKADAAIVPQTVVIPAGTPISVRLQQSISSQSAQAGQHFEAVLDEPIVINGQTVAEKGADAVGHVVAARQSGRLHDSGFLRIALDSVTVNGKMVPVQSSSIYVQGASHKKRNLGWIGGSTAGGALIGGLMGGGKGALIGSAVGAGAGTTAAYTTGKKDVGFAAEHRLTFRTTQPVQLT
jgi:hypothetical protein